MEYAMTKIRPYSGQDDKTICGLWNKSLVHDQINIDNFYQRIIYDVNFDPGKLLIAEQDGTALGFVYATMRRFPDEVAGIQSEQGWIVAFGVESSARRKGVGKILLDSIEEKLRKEGAKKIDVGPYPNNYISPGIDKSVYSSGVEFFLANGYQKTSECCAMHLNLRGYETPAKYVEKKKALEGEGYRFKPYEAADAVSLFAFARESFPAWLPNLRTSILAGRAEKTLIVAQEASGATVGFVLRAMDGTPERFGPFATKPSLQGKGIGTVLFHEMMESMVRERIFYTYFLWTSGRNLDIYATWGMSIFRTYAMVSKILS
jgi:GNAT superfamily N-acetyltransferase